MESSSIFLFAKLGFLFLLEIWPLKDLPPSTRHPDLALSICVHLTSLAVSWTIFFRRSKKKSASRIFNYPVWCTVPIWAGFKEGVEPKWKGSLEPAHGGRGGQRRKEQPSKNPSRSAPEGLKERLITGTRWLEEACKPPLASKLPSCWQSIEVSPGWLLWAPSSSTPGSFPRGPGSP